jgi:hypothetical protein
VPAPSCRPFTVMDGMILVMGVALSLLLLKASDEYNGPLFSWQWFDKPVPMQDESQVPYLSGFTGAVRRGAAPLLLPASFALLIVRLRSPRPALRRLGRQPGFAATSAVALVVGVDFACRVVANIPAFVMHARLAFVPWTFGLLYSHRPVSYMKDALRYLNQGVTTFFDWYQASLWYIHPLLGAAVTAAWAVMALGRASRTEPGWIDRSGIALGLLWVLVLLAYCLSYDWR